VLAIDHVVVPVADLRHAAAEVETRHGLTSLDGGRHLGWGTANRIVPFGDAYIELVAVADPEMAATTAFGRWVSSGTPGRPLGWAVRTVSIEAVSRRLGLSIVPGSGSRRAASSSLGALQVSMSRLTSPGCRSSSNGAMTCHFRVPRRCAIQAVRRR
jgi:hypothetical protein